MLITADFLNYARANNISVGPGRGSAGGSYIAYLIDIHEADSIKYGLVFERFHNKLKLATSDIDNDISPEGRTQVIEYCTKKYGRDHVAHVSNVNTVTPKVYVRDIARVCELGGSREAAVELGNNVADCIPATVKFIDEALANLPLFEEYSKKWKQFKTFSQICGKPRAVATHAAGVVIGSRSLVGLVPVRKDREGNFAIEYDKDQAEENGLVKIDFLGLKTLDIIDDTIKLIKANGKYLPEINVEDCDKKTYDLISSGDTYGVFQFGKPGAIDICKKIAPKNMEDLAVITTLIRPGSKDIRNDFILVRDGKKKVKLPHPILSNALSHTYGFALYDESLLTLAKDVAGWDLGEADKLRKLTKEKGKNKAKTDKWKEEFIEGAVKNKLSIEEANDIWVKVVEPFAKYSFNKSHSVLYSMVSYKTAYLKAHYPIEFLLANLMAEVGSNSPDAKSNKDRIKKEIRAHKIKIVPPDINMSLLSYAMSNESTLITGLDALKYGDLEKVVAASEKASSIEGDLGIEFAGAQNYGTLIPSSASLINKESNTIASVMQPLIQSLVATPKTYTSIENGVVFTRATGDGAIATNSTLSAANAISSVSNFTTQASSSVIPGSYYCSSNILESNVTESTVEEAELVFTNEAQVYNPVTYDEARALLKLTSNVTDPLTLDRRAKQLCQLDRDSFDGIMKAAQNTRK
ncbi:unnamed protein product [Sphagnum balticum]